MLFSSDVLSQVLLGSELLSAGLAVSIAYLMLRSFRVVRRQYLLGFPIGFSFLASAYLLFGISLASPSIAEQSRWAHLLLSSYGYAFLASTYFLKKRSEAWVGEASRWLLALLVLLAVLFVLVSPLIPPAWGLPSYQLSEEVFRIVNLALLGYVLYSLNQSLRSEEHAVSSLVLGGFNFLAIAQLCFLLWTLDGGIWSFTFAHLLRLVGLAMLAIVARKVKTA